MDTLTSWHDIWYGDARHNMQKMLQVHFIYPNGHPVYNPRKVER